MFCNPLNNINCRFFYCNIHTLLICCNSYFAFYLAFFSNIVNVACLLVLHLCSTITYIIGYLLFLYLTYNIYFTFASHINSRIQHCFIYVIFFLNFISIIVIVFHYLEDFSVHPFSHISLMHHYQYLQIICCGLTAIHLFNKFSKAGNAGNGIIKAGPNTTATVCKKIIKPFMITIQVTRSWCRPSSLTPRSPRSSRRQPQDATRKFAQ